MIYGYAANASLRPGERLLLHVSCSAARFRVVIYRWIGKLERVLASSWLNGERAGVRSAADDWEWPQYGVQLPSDWPSGVYIAHVHGRDSADPHIAMTDAAVLFVVRGQSRGGLLYKLPLATYNAYNHAGGACLYDKPPRSLDPPGARLSFHRPGLGIGGPTFGAPDFCDPSAPRQTFAHWDAPFIGWLLCKGYALDFCTDLDIHHDPDLLHRYRLLLSAGHDAYWSTAMRDGVADFIAQGGNVAFFSAKLCWRRIQLVDGATAMVCHQGGPDGARDHWWPPTGAGRTEDGLSGAAYRHGGRWWEGPSDKLGFAVQDPEHWIFNGTGLQHGERFGAGANPPLVGYECGGAPLAGFDHESGTAPLAGFDHESGAAPLLPLANACGTPRGYRLLAACALNERWHPRPHREARASASGIHAATMGMFTQAGTVFQAGMPAWTQVLAGGQDPHVETITRNVIDGLLGIKLEPLQGGGAPG